MNYLEDDKISLLLNKEWLVKVDTAKSISYLMKFCCSTVDQWCCVMITDTKHVWGEVLSSKILMRRWRDCNAAATLPWDATDEEEDEWCTHILELLASAHSLGGFGNLYLKTIDSRQADIAIEIGSDIFKWKWEAYSLGPKVSADVLSAHLIMPLISVSHLAFSSADPVGEQVEADLEKAVDKVGRTARRTADMHVKHALSKPRVATTLRRMSAVFNFLPDMPPILSDAPAPALKIPTVRRPRVPERLHELTKASQHASPGPSRSRSSYEPSRQPSPVGQKSLGVADPPGEVEDDSLTEHSDDEHAQPATATTRATVAGANHNPLGSKTRASVLSTPPPPSPIEPPHEPSPDASSPIRPLKKAKKVASSSGDSEEDSEEERKRRVARLKATSSRGAKQPLKRGGKRF